LLEDIPKFGRRGEIIHFPYAHAHCETIGANNDIPDSVFRIERGRMRNEWFPAMKAEYMTASRFRELGLTREDIGDRDTTFGTMAAADDIEDAPVFEAPKAVLTTSVWIPRNPPPPVAIQGLL
jgi:hypothetical protein